MEKVICLNMGIFLFIHVRTDFHCTNIVAKNSGIGLNSFTKYSPPGLGDLGLDSQLDLKSNEKYRLSL